jgi:hypothetical protein
MTIPVGQLFQNPIVKPLSSNATFMSACTATFYVTQTTNLAAIYADGLLTAPLGNPLTADASGTFPAIYLDPTVIYRVQIKTSTGVLISDTDPYVVAASGTPSQTVVGNALYPKTANEIAASVTIVNPWYPPMYVDRYGTNTNPGVTDMVAAFNAAIKVAMIAGGVVRYGATAPYRTASAINCTTAGAPNLPGFTIRNEAGPGISPPKMSLVFDHPGHGFDFTGTASFVLENVSMTSGTTAPKTFIFQARNKANGSGNEPSVGFSRFMNCNAVGSASIALYYNYGAEDDQIHGGYWNNASTAAGAKCLSFTGNNIASLTSSFLNVATGAQSCIDHKIFGGEFFMQSADAAADCISIEQSDGVKIFGPWMYCANGSNAGGRSLIYIDMTNAASNFCTFEAIEGENNVAALQNYGVLFSNHSQTPSGFAIRDCRFPNSTREIASAGSSPTMDSFYIENISGTGSSGIAFPGTVQNSFISAVDLTIGVSKNNELAGFTDRWTITTRSNDVWTDQGTVNKSWTPNTSALTVVGGLSVTDAHCTFHANLCTVRFTMQPTTSVACAAGTLITGLPATPVGRSPVSVVDVTSTAAIGSGIASSSGLALPAISVTGHTIVVQATFAVA